MKSDETLDRLSELPDSLILLILSFLPMRDVVRTTFLSKRWKDLWFTLPTLHFCEDKMRSANSRNFINRALKLWKGTQIQKLEFSFGEIFDELILYDMDLWVSFAKGRNVEQLSIQIPHFYLVYEPPQCLYSCSSLRKLSLVNCFLEISGNVHWHQLKSLELHGLNFSEDIISQVVSSSPQLEILLLGIHGGHGNMTLRSRSLRMLSVYNSYYGPSSVLTVYTPKLETLSISGGPCYERFQIDAPSVTALTLDFMDELVGLLEKFPKVERLLIHWKFGEERNILVRGMRRFALFDSFNFDGGNYSAGLLKQLKTVEITWSFYDVDMFQFVELLLEHGAMIEKIVIQRSGNQEVGSEYVFLAAQKLLSLQRSFPNVEIVFCKE